MIYWRAVDVLRRLTGRLLVAEADIYEQVNAFALRGRSTGENDGQSSGFSNRDQMNAVVCEIDEVSVQR